MGKIQVSKQASFLSKDILLIISYFGSVLLIPNFLLQVQFFSCRFSFFSFLAIFGFLPIQNQKTHKWNQAGRWHIWYSTVLHSEVLPLIIIDNENTISTYCMQFSLYFQSLGRSMMPSSFFTGNPQQLSIKYRIYIEICTKLDSPNGLGTIKIKKELNTLHILYMFIPYQHILFQFIPYRHIQILCSFTYISSITVFLCYQWQNKGCIYGPKKNKQWCWNKIVFYHFNLFLRSIRNTSILSYICLDVFIFHKK
jgi:hypothetical protein